MIAPALSRRGTRPPALHRRPAASLIDPFPRPDARALSFALYDLRLTLPNP